MLNFAVCDDEPVMVKDILDRLSEYMAEKKWTPYRVRSFLNGRSLLESGCDFDLIFLDIQMEQPNGMETAKRLRRQKKDSLLIFVTVLRECVFDAFEVEAYDYLIKPLDGRHFRKTMDRALRTLAQRTAKRIVIRHGNSCEVILLDRILYCEVQGRKIYIHQSNGTVTDYYDKLSQFERRVDGRVFKCHRSYLVNLDYVCGCNNGQVILSQGSTIPVSRLREGDLTQALLHHLKERDF